MKILATVVIAAFVFVGYSVANARTQYVRYAVHNTPVSAGFEGCGFSDKARFILHIGTTAFLFGKQASQESS